MDMGNPTPLRQRHRRSDRYLEEMQAPAVKQAIVPQQAQPDVMSSAPRQHTVPMQQVAVPKAAAAPRQAQPDVTLSATKQQAPVQQAGMPKMAAVPQQTQSMPSAAAPKQHAAPVQQSVVPQQAQWPQRPEQMTRTQQPLGHTLHSQQVMPPVSNVLQPRQDQGHTIPPQPIQRMQTPQQPQQMPQPQQPHLSQTIPPQQAGFMPPQPSFSNTIPPQQPSRGWEGVGQPAFYGQPQAPWQQPYHGQQGREDRIYDTPQMMPAPEGPSQMMPDDPSNQPLAGFPWQIIAAALVLLVLVIGGIFGIRAAVKEGNVRSYVSSYDTRFCEGVYVDGIHLGGMTQQEGVEAVAKQAQQRNSDWYVRLTYQGRTVVEMNAALLGMRVDVADALRRAWEQGHASSDPHERLAAMERLQQEPYKDYTALPSGDTSVVDNVLEELRNKVYRAPQDAYLSEFNPDKTYPFTIEDEVAGMMLNTDSLKERIYQMVATMQSGELEIEPESIAPNVTAAQIRESIALRADEYTEISTTSTDNRNANIKRALSLINGTILKPGDTFSFNTVVGRRTTANGFYEATEYAYGKEVQGIGGGVCQASTTMYLAAVAANLQITKHTPHSMAVGYTTYGKDATVSWEGNRQVDFAFTNNTDGNIYIVASVQFDRTISKYNIARVRIYGPYLGDGVRYKLEATEVETIPKPEPEYRKDTKGDYADKITYTDEEYPVSQGREGHITESYSVKYVNGAEVERTFLFRDVYNAAAPIIYRGTQERW